MNTADKILPAEARADDEDEAVDQVEIVDRASRRRRALWYVLGSVSGLIVAVLIAAAVVEIPYYALSPGSVWPTEDLIDIEGTEQFESDGRVGFTTVSLERATALQALLGWVDPSIDLVPEEQILGDQNAEENRKENLARMDESKDAAVAVALQALGYDVIEGTGARVLEIGPDEPAAEILVVDDVIVAVDGQETDLWDDVVRAVGSHRPGDTINLTIDPADGGGFHDVQAVLAERPDDPSKALLGVVGETRDLSFDFPFDVTIDSGAVGGPSAGLAFTLGVLDLLTEGDLTGGKFVATTGTIALDGRVGPVGGVPQKTVAAHRAGVELFIVPSVEFDEAKSFADGMAVAKADTLDQALAALEDFGGDRVDLDERAAA